MSKVKNNVNKNFWLSLKRPFFCLAPMADVSDIAFRQIIAKYSRHGKAGGGPDVFWTEFVSADGLVNKEGRKKLLPLLKFSAKEKPIIAQLFGAKPESMRKACALVAEMGFAGIDINMGCPDKKVERQGAGSALIKNPELAREIIKSAFLGVKDSGKDIPISVKTRIGYNKDEIENWIPVLVNSGISAITIHGRTRKELSLVPANWEKIKGASEIAKSINPKIIVIGNGDVSDLKDGKEKALKYKVDGIMIGRGIFGKPWLFDSKIKEKSITKEKRIKILLEHIKLFEKYLSNRKNFDIMKKHFKAYISGWNGAKELRIKLMSAKTAGEAMKTLLNISIDK